MSLIIDTSEDAKDYYGFTSPNYNIRYVGIEKIWNDTKEFKKFVKVFTESWDHEIVHSLIHKKSYSQFGEEFIIRKLFKEPFNEDDKKFYKGLDGKACNTKSGTRKVK